MQFCALLHHFRYCFQPPCRRWAAPAVAAWHYIHRVGRTARCAGHSRTPASDAARMCAVWVQSRALRRKISEGATAERLSRYRARRAHRAPIAPSCSLRPPSEARERLVKARQQQRRAFLCLATMPAYARMHLPAHPSWMAPPRHRPRPRRRRLAPGAERRADKQLRLLADRHVGRVFVCSQVNQRACAV